MQLGDIVTIAGVDWKLRAFTPAEHERFDLMAAEHNLIGMAAQLAAMADARHGTAREKLFQADIKRLEAKLAKFTTEDGAALKDGLTEEERLEAYGYAAEIDLLHDKMEQAKAEPRAALLALEDEYRMTRESVVGAFLHSVIQPDMPLEEFLQSLNPEDSLVLDEVVLVGKLRAGLSARERREQAALMRIIQLGTSEKAGNDSESQQRRQVAREKLGQSGRSKKSSSKSKAGA